MGRGRAKAKQTKVARQLKYGGPATDLERLQAELVGTPVESVDSEEDDEFDEDPYAKYLADDEDDGEGEDSSR